MNQHSPVQITSGLTVPIYRIRSVSLVDNDVHVALDLKYMGDRSTIVSDLPYATIVHNWEQACVKS
jgi:hypothetical protein